MKYAIAVLIGAASAVKLGTTPPDFREPVDANKFRWAWNETMKSSTGL